LWCRRRIDYQGSYVGEEEEEGVAAAVASAAGEVVTSVDVGRGVEWWEGWLLAACAHHD
jgi:hypothetical protein